jgi:hypothetical protein
MYLEEGNRTLAACKAMHKRLRQQNKKGEALRQQFDDGTKKDAADVVRFRAEAECHCQESESIRNDKSVEALLAAFRQQCHSGTRQAVFIWTSSHVCTKLRLKPYKLNPTPLICSALVKSRLGIPKMFLSANIHVLFIISSPTDLIRSIVSVCCMLPYLNRLNGHYYQITLPRFYDIMAHHAVVNVRHLTRILTKKKPKLV